MRNIKKTFICCFVCCSLVMRLPAEEVVDSQQQTDLSETNFRVATYKGDRTAAISYTFDDGLMEHYTLVAPHLEALDFRGTFFINGSNINDSSLPPADSTRLNWAQLKEMSDKGHEISNHGWAHKNFSRFPLEEIKEDIYKNDSAIIANIGVIPRTFCYPNNNQKADGVKIAVQNRVGTRKFQQAIGSRQTPESLEEWVNKLIDTNDWGVGMTHGLTYGYDAFGNPQRFWDHLEKVKAKEDKIWVGTFHEVAAYIECRKALTFDQEKTTNGLRVTPRLSLDKNVFATLLTGVIDRKDSRAMTVRQGNKELKTHMLPDKMLFDFDPFGGPIDIELL